MENKTAIVVGQQVWFCPSYEGFNSGLACFMVKCTVREIYILDSSKTEEIQGIPCSTIVNLKSDEESVPEGSIIFYDLDEPIGHSVDRDTIFPLDNFDQDGILDWLADEEWDLFASKRFGEENPDLDKWREKMVAGLNKNGCPDLKVSDYQVKKKDVDWFAASV